MVKFPNPPSQRGPLIDKSGIVSRFWYNWFQSIVNAGNGANNQAASAGQGSVTATSPIIVTPIAPPSPPISFPNAVIKDPAGNQTIDNGLLVVTDGIQTSQLNNVLYADQFTGSDIGAQINAAYAALPSAGGKIIVSPKSDGTPYGFSTPIVFNTVGKSVILEGAGNSWIGGTVGGTVLNYTPTSGTAILLDWGVSGSRAVGEGVRNLTLINNSVISFSSVSGTAKGIEIGSTNGAVHTYFFNLHIIGFPTGFKNSQASADNAWDASFLKCYINSNTTGVDFGAGFEAGGFEFCRFVANDTHFTEQAGDTYFVQCSFDSHNTAGLNLNFTGVSTAGFAEFHGCHFEAPNGSNTHFITGNGNWKIFGGTAVDIATVGTPDYFFNAGGGFAYASGLEVVGSRVATQIIKAASPVRVYANIVYFGLVFTSPVVTSTYANAIVGATVSNNSNANQQELIEEAVAGSTPPSGQGARWFDSTDHRFHDKNSSGTIGTTVVANTGASHNFLTAISAAGVVSKAQPASTDISDYETNVSWTPSVANLTQAGGSATIVAKYSRIGKLVTFSITITPVTSTSSTANSTTFTLPFTPTIMGACIATDDQTTALGNGLLFTDGKCYPPTWTTVSRPVVVTGTFQST